MRQIIFNLSAVLALLLASCSTDTPTQVANDRDDMIARIVAGAAGYESNGLVATLNDLASAGTGATLRQSITGAPRTSVVVTESDSIFDPSSRSQTLSLACQRNRADAFSDWRLRYTIQFANVRQEGDQVQPAVPLRAQTHTEGTFRNSTLKAKGESRGDLLFERVETDGRVGLSGEYRWAGTATIGDERYDDVTVKFTWSGLDVNAGAGGDGLHLGGRCDISIYANGPDGAIAKTGSLTFGGGDRALLVLGGREYPLNIRQAE